MRAVAATALVLSIAAGARAEDLETYLAEKIEAIREHHDLPSISAAVVGQSGVLFTCSTGKANVAENADATGDTAYGIASITKVLTATALVRLLRDNAAAEGKTLSDKLDESVETLLSGVVASGSSLSGITFRHVLSHRITISPGLEYDDEYPLWEEVDRPPVSFKDVLASRTLTSLPTAAYSNESFLVAGYLLARLHSPSATEHTVKHYEDAMQTHLYAQLGGADLKISPTPEMVERLALPYAFLDPDQQVRMQQRFFPMSAGEAYASARGLGAFLHLGFISTGVTGDVNAAMRATQAVDSEGEFGLGWRLWKEGGGTDPLWIYHDGRRSGYVAYAIAQPESGKRKGICFLANGDGGDGIFLELDTLGMDVVDMMDDALLRIPRFEMRNPIPFDYPPEKFDRPPEMYMDRLPPMPEFPPLFSRGLDPLVSFPVEGGLAVALPGRLWLFRGPGDGDRYSISPFRGGTFRRKLPGFARNVTWTRAGLAWSEGLDARPFRPARQLDLATWTGAWGGALHADGLLQPVSLSVGASSAVLTTGTKRMTLSVATDGEGRLLGVHGTDTHNLVRVAFERHGTDELIGTWQRGPHRRLLHLRSGADAGWRARFTPAAWSGTWDGDVSQDLEWATLRLLPPHEGSAGEVSSRLLKLQEAPMRAVRWNGRSVAFEAGDWQFRGQVVGPLFSGEARRARSSALFLLRRS